MNRREYLNLQLSGFRSFFMRGMVRLWRLRYQNIAYLIGAIFNFYVLGVLIGRNITSVVPFSRQIMPGVLVTLLMNMSLQDPCWNLFIQRWNRELQAALASPVNTFTVLLSFIAVTFARVTLSFTFFYGALSFLGNATILHPAPFFMLLFNMVLFFSLVGLRCGIHAKDFADAGALEGVLINIGLSLSGALYSLDMIDIPLIRTLVKLNPFYYLLSAFRHYFWGATAFIPPMGANLIFLGVNLLLFLYVVRLFENSPNIRS